MTINLAATAAFGLEAVVQRELNRLGYAARIGDGGRVHFAAGLADVPRANLWLRAADRVLIHLGSFPARTFDELFEGTKDLPWPDWLPEGAAFPVIGKCVRSQLMSVPDCQAIVKKAVVESLKRVRGGGWLVETGPLYRIEISLLRDIASLSIDTTGPGLHKRGYRPVVAPAPLKETLAAGLVLLSGWRPESSFLDPCCGSGTIPIEAALIGLNLAPGIRRGFTAETWPQIPPALWAEARSEAADLADSTIRLEIEGADIDPAMIELAREHAQRAGVGREIRWRTAAFGTYRPAGGRGTLVANPPYGERIGENLDLDGLYREIGRAHRAWGGWSFNILAAAPGFERLFGRRATRRRKLYNGRIECQYYQYGAG